MRSGLGVVSLLVGFLLAFSILASAQTATTSLRGAITDPKGAVLPGATVTLNNPATGFSRTTKSGNDGEYHFLQVPPATYLMTRTLSSFSTINHQNAIPQR